MLKNAGGIAAILPVVKKKWDIAIPVSSNGTPIPVWFHCNCRLTNHSKTTQTKLWDACHPKEEQEPKQPTTRDCFWWYTKPKDSCHQLYKGGGGGVPSYVSESAASLATIDTWKLSRSSMPNTLNIWHSYERPNSRCSIQTYIRLNTELILSYDNSRCFSFKLLILLHCTVTLSCLNLLPTLLWFHRLKFTMLHSIPLASSHYTFLPVI